MIKEYFNILKLVMLGILYLVVFIIPPLMFFAFAMGRENDKAMICLAITIITYPALVMVTKRIA